MSNPKFQHYVPACYLREFVDSDGFVWIFSRDGKTKRKQKPERTFGSNHLYTINVKGKKDYRIEKTLANIEGAYAKIFKDKIKKHKPLSDYEHIILCVFVAAQLQRTLRFKENEENFIQQIVEMGTQVALSHGVESEEVKKWQEYKQDAHKITLVQSFPHLTKILMQMSLAFLCSPNPQKHYFITSDDPCVMFNPDLQWQKFYGPGFGQQNVQLTLPLSPEIAVMFCWANYKGYSWLSGSRLEEFNRMTRGHCNKEFLTSSEKVKSLWLWKLPPDLFFMLRAIRKMTPYYIYKVKRWWRDRKYA